MTDELISECVFECVKIAWTQDKNGYVLKLSIHPDEVNSSIALDPLGTRYKIGIVKAESVEQPDISPERRAIQTAGLLCRNPLFTQYIRTRYGSVHAVDESSTAAALRTILGCGSRSEIAGPAANKMMEIAHDFREWAKKPRGNDPRMEEEFGL
jgi:hypothetical protein